MLRPTCFLWTEGPRPAVGKGLPAVATASVPEGRNDGVRDLRSWASRSASRVSCITVGKSRHGEFKVEYHTDAESVCATQLLRVIAWSAHSPERAGAMETGRSRARDREGGRETGDKQIPSSTVIFCFNAISPVLLEAETRGWYKNLPQS